MPLPKRAELFSAYFRAQLSAGLPIMREVHSAADHVVRVKDRVSSRVDEMVMFGSNNYLGLATNPRVRSKLHELLDGYGTGLGGPPFLNGTTTLHRRLEGALAEFKSCEDAMLFSSGFAANYALVTALAGPRDAVILDSLCHTSLQEGARASGAKIYRFLHNDMNALAAAMARAEAGQHTTRLVFVEGVYSMDGDVPPLDRVFEIAQQFDAMLVLDDAHGTGVLGEHGRGAAECFGLEGKIPLVMGTFSKALASSGGFVCGPRAIIDYLRFFGKTYFFSASMPPLFIAHILASLEVLRESPELRRQLFRNVDYLKRRFHEIGIPVRSESAILPVYVPRSVPIRVLARRLHECGAFVNYVEYPAVPADKQRFRVSVMATHTPSDMERLIGAFREVFAEAGLLNLQRQTEESSSSSV